MKKIELNSSELSNKVQSVSKVQSNKNTLPILDCVRFECKDGKLNIEAAEEGCYARSWMSVNSGENVVFGINSKTLKDVLKTLPEQNITLSVDSASVIIKHAQGKVELPNESMEEWPATPEAGEDNCLSVSADALRSILAHCHPFIMPDELRPVMNAICLRFGNEAGKLDAVASDGHSLIKQTHDCSFCCKGENTILIYNRFAKSIEQMLGKQTDTVDIFFNDRFAYVRLQEFDCTIRLIEGKYPNYNSVIPTNYSSSVAVNKKEFTKCLEYVMPCSNASSMILSMTIKDGQISMRTADTDFGKSADANLPAEITGHDTVVGLKTTSLVEIMKHIPTDEVVMMYSDAGRAWMFLPKEQLSDMEQTIILMPMMLS